MPLSYRDLTKLVLKSTVKLVISVSSGTNRATNRFYATDMHGQCNNACAVQHTM